jgi:endoglucanase
MMKAFLSDLQRLSDAFGVSGAEDDVADLIVEMIGDAADETWRDPLGNLFAMRRGDSHRKLLLDGHMDEIGFLVRHIDDSGYLSISPVGGWDLRVLPAQAVTLRIGPGRFVDGVIGSTPPHVQESGERTRAFGLDSLYVDIGCSSAEEADELGVRIGTPLTLAYPFRMLNEKVALGKALDNRVGCATAIATLRALRNETPPVTIVASFTTGEEVGLRGASTVAAQIEPDVALILEGTVDGATPGVSPANRPTERGKGCAFTTADKSFIVSQRMLGFLEGVARDEGIPTQRRRPGFGGTNAGIIHRSHRGVLCGVIAAPCRYIHSPHSTAHVHDLEAMVKMTIAATRRITDLFIPDGEAPRCRVGGQGAGARETGARATWRDEKQRAGSSK